MKKRKKLNGDAIDMIDMNEKYYTPSIEEFHVGFEFKSKVVSYYKSIEDVTDAGLTKKDVEETTKSESHYGRYKRYYWEDCIVDEDTFYGYNISEYNINNIRVKYLDSSDIKSLGWNFIPDTTVGDGNFRWYDLYTIGDYCLVDNWSRITIRESSDHINGWFISSNTIFQGTIKNKSQLTQVMEMLGINFNTNAK